ncbi:unnamed protein product [Dicrocoelium dendriticum]|nr:unnamed protein product [Dicrocoelium dendriticum]
MQRPQGSQQTDSNTLLGAHHPASPKSSPRTSHTGSRANEEHLTGDIRKYTNTDGNTSDARAQAFDRLHTHRPSKHKHEHEYPTPIFPNTIEPTEHNMPHAITATNDEMKRNSKTSTDTQIQPQPAYDRINARDAHEQETHTITPTHSDSSAERTADVSAALISPAVQTRTHSTYTQQPKVSKQIDSNTLLEAQHPASSKSSPRTSHTGSRANEEHLTGDIRKYTNTDGNTSDARAQALDRLHTHMLSNHEHERDSATFTVTNTIKPTEHNMPHAITATNDEMKRNSKTSTDTQIQPQPAYDRINARDAHEQETHTITPTHSDSSAERPAVVSASRISPAVQTHTHSTYMQRPEVSKQTDSNTLLEAQLPASPRSSRQTSYTCSRANEEHLTGDIRKYTNTDGNTSDARAQALDRLHTHRPSKHKHEHEYPTPIFPNTIEPTEHNMPHAITATNDEMKRNSKTSTDTQIQPQPAYDRINARDAHEQETHTITPTHSDSSAERPAVVSASRISPAVQTHTHSTYMQRPEVSKQTDSNTLLEAQLPASPRSSRQTSYTCSRANEEQLTGDIRKYTNTDGNTSDARAQALDRLHTHRPSKHKHEHEYPTPIFPNTIEPTEHNMPHAITATNDEMKRNSKTSTDTQIQPQPAYDRINARDAHEQETHTITPTHSDSSAERPAVVSASRISPAVQTHTHSTYMQRPEVSKQTDSNTLLEAQLPASPRSSRQTSYTCSRANEEHLTGDIRKYTNTDGNTSDARAQALDRLHTHRPSKHKHEHEYPTPIFPNTIEPTEHNMPHAITATNDEMKRNSKTSTDTQIQPQPAYDRINARDAHEQETHTITPTHSDSSAERPAVVSASRISSAVQTHTHSTYMQRPQGSQQTDSNTHLGAHHPASPKSSPQISHTCSRTNEEQLTGDIRKYTNTDGNTSDARAQALDRLHTHRPSKHKHEHEYPTPIFPNTIEPTEHNMPHAITATNDEMKRNSKTSTDTQIQPQPAYDRINARDAHEQETHTITPTHSDSSAERPAVVSASRISPAVQTHTHSTYMQRPEVSKQTDSNTLLEAQLPASPRSSRQTSYTCSRANEEHLTGDIRKYTNTDGNTSDARAQALDRLHTHRPSKHKHEHEYPTPIFPNTIEPTEHNMPHAITATNDEMKRNSKTSTDTQIQPQPAYDRINARDAHEQETHTITPTHSDSSAERPAVVSASRISPAVQTHTHSTYMQRPEVSKQTDSNTLLEAQLPASPRSSRQTSYTCSRANEEHLTGDIRKYTNTDGNTSDARAQALDRLHTHRPSKHKHEHEYPTPIFPNTIEPTEHNMPHAITATNDEMKRNSKTSTDTQIQPQPAYDRINARDAHEQETHTITPTHSDSSAERPAVVSASRISPAVQTHTHSTYMQRPEVSKQTDSNTLLGAHHPASPKSSPQISHTCSRTKEEQLTGDIRKYTNTDGNTSDARAQALDRLHNHRPSKHKHEHEYPTPIFPNTIEPTEHNMPHAITATNDEMKRNSKTSTDTQIQPQPAYDRINARDAHEQETHTITPTHSDSSAERPAVVSASRISPAVQTHTHSTYMQRPEVSKQTDSNTLLEAQLPASPRSSRQTSYTCSRANEEHLTGDIRKYTNTDGNTSDARAQALDRLHTHRPSKHKHEHEYPTPIFPNTIEPTEHNMPHAITATNDEMKRNSKTSTDTQIQPQPAYDRINARDAHEQETHTITPTHSDSSAERPAVVSASRISPAVQTHTHSTYMQRPEVSKQTDSNTLLGAQHPASPKSSPHISHTCSRANEEQLTGDIRKYTNTDGNTSDARAQALDRLHTHRPSKHKHEHEYPTPIFPNTIEPTEHNMPHAITATNDEMKRNSKTSTDTQIQPQPAYDRINARDAHEQETHTITPTHSDSSAERPAVVSASRISPAVQTHTHSTYMQRPEVSKQTDSNTLLEAQLPASPRSSRQTSYTCSRANEEQLTGDIRKYTNTDGNTSDARAQALDRLHTHRPSKHKHEHEYPTPIFPNTIEPTEHNMPHAITATNDEMKRNSKTSTDTQIQPQPAYDRINARDAHEQETHTITPTHSESSAERPAVVSASRISPAVQTHTHSTYMQRPEVSKQTDSNTLLEAQLPASPRSSRQTSYTCSRANEEHLTGDIRKYTNTDGNTSDARAQALDRLHTHRPSKHKHEHEYPTPIFPNTIEPTEHNMPHAITATNDEMKRNSKTSTDTQIQPQPAYDRINARDAHEQETHTITPTHSDSSAERPAVVSASRISPAVQTHTHSTYMQRPEVSKQTDSNTLLEAQLPVSLSHRPTSHTHAVERTKNT